MSPCVKITPVFSWGVKFHNELSNSDKNEIDTCIPGFRTFKVSELGTVFELETVFEVSAIRKFLLLKFLNFYCIDQALKMLLNSIMIYIYIRCFTKIKKPNWHFASKRFTKIPSKIKLYIVGLIFWRTMYSSVQCISSIYHNLRIKQGFKTYAAVFVGLLSLYF